VLDGVFLGELVPVYRTEELLELVKRLLAQVIPVHEEQNPLGVGIEHVVGVTGGEWEFPNGHAQARRDVHLAVVLHDPASLFKLAVDLPPGLLFGCHGPLCFQVAGVCCQ
jgi:hypothetical protein